MARLAFGAAGAFIGNAIAPGVGGSWGWSIGAFLGGALFPEQLPDVHQQGPRLDDLNVQSSAYGNAIPWVRGTVRLGGNVIWSEPLTEVATTTTEEQGGKGGPTQSVSQTTYQYFATFAIAFCEGEIAGVRRLWFNGELILDRGVAATSGDYVLGHELWSGKFRVYRGTETQTVDSAIEDYEGADASSAYRGTAYIVFDALDVTQNRTLPLIEAEVVQSGTEGQLVTYFDQFLVTDAGGNLASAEYVSDSTEVWIRDQEYAEISPLRPARLAAYNLTTGTVAYASLPDLYPYGLSGSGGGRLMQYFKEWNLILTTGRYLDSPFYSTGIYFSAATKQVVGVYGTVVTHCDVMCVDVSNNRALLANHITARIEIWELGSDHLPVSMRVEFTGYYSYNDSRVDSEGNFWVARLNARWTKLSLSGLVTEYIPSNGIKIDAHKCEYDPTRNCIYYWSNLFPATTEYLQKIDCATGAISIVATYSTVGTNPWDSEIRYDQEIDRVIICNGGVVSPFAAFVVDPSNGSTTTYTITDIGGALFAGPFAYAANTIWSFSSPTPMVGGTLGELRFDALTETPPTLASVRADLNAEVGITAAKLNSTALTSTTVRGYAVMRIGTARAAEEPLMQRYAYDVVESDGKLKAVLRGGNLAYAFSADELGVGEGSSDQPTLRVVRKNIREQPSDVRIEYPDLDSRYAVGMQHEQVVGLSHVNPVEFSSSVVMTANEAKQMAQRLAYSAHASRYQISWSTSHEFAWLEPTDIVTLPRGNVTYTVRIVDKRYSGNRIEWAGETEDPSVYTQSGAGGIVAASISNIYAIGATIAYLLDIPLLLTQHDSPGIYVAGAGTIDTWQGAALHRSTDGGTNYSDTGVLLLPGGAVGNATTALGNFLGGNTFDTLNSVTVSVLPGSITLSSTSRLNVLNGTNHAVIGDEIIAFATVTLVSTNVYKLSDLLRGRAGTEQHISTHVAGEAFALLSTGAQRLTLSTNDMGNVLNYKAVTFKRTVAQTGPTTATFANIRQKCLSPVHLRAERNASTNDVTISWTRRSRYPSGWVDYNDIPIGETSESYDLEIWNSGSYTTLKRTFSDLTTSSQSYTSAQQTTDFGGPQTTIYCRVYQKNTIVGRGFVLQGSIT